LREAWSNAHDPGGARESPITGATAHGDHFIAWSRYPSDLGHNLYSRITVATTKSVIDCPLASIWWHGRRGTQSMVSNWDSDWRSAAL